MQAPVGAAHFGKLWFSIVNTKFVKPSVVACFFSHAVLRRASGAALQIFLILGGEAPIGEGGWPESGKSGKQRAGEGRER